MDGSNIVDRPSLNIRYALTVTQGILALPFDTDREDPVTKQGGRGGYLNT